MLATVIMYITKGWFKVVQIFIPDIISGMVNITRKQNDSILFTTEIQCTVIGTVVLSQLPITLLIDLLID